MIDQPGAVGFEPGAMPSGFSSEAWCRGDLRPFVATYIPKEYLPRSHYGRAIQLTVGVRLAPLCDVFEPLPLADQRSTRHDSHTHLHWRTATIVEQCSLRDQHHGTTETHGFPPTRVRVFTAIRV